MAIALLAGSSSADLSGRYQTGKQRAGQLQSEIQSDSTRIQGFDGSIGDLEQRLGAIQRSITVQEGQLSDVRTSLDHARTRLTSLQAQYERGRRILAAQLVAQYESPPPTLMNVVVDAQGFDDLLNRVSDLRTVERHSTETVFQVKQARTAVTAQTKRLASIESRKRARDHLGADRARQRRSAAPVDRPPPPGLRRRPQPQGHRADLAAQDADPSGDDPRPAGRRRCRAAGAGAAPSGGAPVPLGSCANTPFVAHGGSYGFFPAAGTNYSVNQEPIIAARLDQLGRALQLHLVGISGYRSPQHSVEVGGFSDDPHTEGEASDTPGVEGVPEATLNRFCLTRPFGGAREADHIQEN